MNLKLAFCLILLMISQHARALDIEAKALFDGAALLSIDGRDVMVRVGELTEEGVKLVKADSWQAIVDYEGTQKSLNLSDRIAASFKAPEKSQVMINVTDNNQYIAQGSINGRPVRFLVDTGANVMALSATTARSLGISTANGEKAMAASASDKLPVTVVVLKEVQVGPIRQTNVRAVITEGDYPRDVLLGMTFLQHVDISENAGLMVLTSKL